MRRELGRAFAISLYVTGCLYIMLAAAISRPRLQHDGLYSALIFVVLGLALHMGSILARMLKTYDQLARAER